MKQLLLVLCILLMTDIVQAQFPVKSNPSLPNYNSSRNGYNFGLSYHSTNFYNKVFRDNLETGVLKRSLGANMKLSYFYKAFIIDFNGFISGYKLGEHSNIALPLGYPSDSFFLNHQGYDVYISYNLLPTSVSWLRRLLTPYIGLGYQYSALALTNKTYWFGVNAHSVYKFNNPMWKAGLYLNLHSNFNVFGEFKQPIGLFTNKDRMFSQFNVGLSFKLYR